MKRNLIGAQIRRLRCNKGWSQNDLATRLQLRGWDISRSGVARIESSQSGLGDFRIVMLEDLFHVQFKDMFPTLEARQQAYKLAASLSSEKDE